MSNFARNVINCTSSERRIDKSYKRKAQIAEELLKFTMAISNTNATVTPVNHQQTIHFENCIFGGHIRICK